MSQSHAGTTYLPLDRIVCDNAWNSRKNLLYHECESLAATIREFGLLQAIIVQPDGTDYKIVAGHRRYTACEILGWKEVECKVVSGLDARRARLLNVIENLEREELRISDESQVVKEMYPPETPIRHIARDMGKSENWVKVRWLFSRLPGWAREEADKKTFTQQELLTIINSDHPPTAAKGLLRGKNNPLRASKLARTKSQKLTKRDVKNKIIELLERGVPHEVLCLMNWCINEVDDARMEEAVNKLLGDKYGTKSQQGDKH